MKGADEVKALGFPECDQNDLMTLRQSIYQSLCHTDTTESYSNDRLKIIPLKSILLIGGHPELLLHAKSAHGMPHG